MKRNASTLDGLICIQQEGMLEHLHVSLAIYVNGQQGSVPTGIGIVAPPGSRPPLVREERIARLEGRDGISSALSLATATCLLAGPCSFAEQALR